MYWIHNPELEQVWVHEWNQLTNVESMMTLLVQSNPNDIMYHLQQGTEFHTSSLTKVP